MTAAAPNNGHANSPNCRPMTASAPMPATPATTGTGCVTTAVATAELNANGCTRGPWSRPAAGTFGNVARNSFFGPHFFNMDASLSKTFHITEGTNLEMRADANNAFNHPQFDADPNGGFGGGGSSVNNVLSTGQLGLIGAAGPPRILQIGGKLVF